MKSSLILLIAISLIILNNPIQAQDSDIKTKLVGNWIYSGFEQDDELPPMSKSEAEKAEKMNKGLIITFGTDGHYQIWKKVNGKKEVLASGKTRLTKEKHLSIEGLEGDIQTLSKDYLKLFSSEDRPIMVFKKYVE